MLQKKPAAAPRIHSVAVWPAGREFAGSFEVGRANYKLTYAPAKAEVAGGRLQLEGRLTVAGPGGRARSRDGVKARLLATQGSTAGLAPERPRSPGLAHAAVNAPGELPVTEYTGPLGFTGVMFLRLDPLDGGALGVRADLSAVQLNARFYTVDERARQLHGLYSALAEALRGERPDAAAATAYVGELNRLLTA